MKYSELLNEIKYAYNYSLEDFQEITQKPSYIIEKWLEGDGIPDRSEIKKMNIRLMEDLMKDDSSFEKLLSTFREDWHKHFHINKRRSMLIILEDAYFNSSKELYGEEIKPGMMKSVIKKEDIIPQAAHLVNRAIAEKKGKVEIFTNFSLTDPDAAKIFRFSFLDCQSKEVDINFFIPKNSEKKDKELTQNVHIFADRFYYVNMKVFLDQGQKQEPYIYIKDYMLMTFHYNLKGEPFLMNYLNPKNVIQRLNEFTRLKAFDSISLSKTASSMRNEFQIIRDLIVSNQPVKIYESCIQICFLPYFLLDRILGKMKISKNLEDMVRKIHEGYKILFLKKRVDLMLSSRMMSPDVP